MQNYHIVLDLEMNPTEGGHNGLQREIIEIGAVKIDAATNRVMDEFSCLVKPQFHHRIDPQITRLTGITTAEVSDAVGFCEAFSAFIRWVGDGAGNIYTWSPTDCVQLRQECRAKDFAFPEDLGQWVDYQAEYPRYLGYSGNRCFGLDIAAEMIGTYMDHRQAHRALYDAQITAKLVLFALTGEYLHYTSRLGKVSAMTYSIGDACGGKLALLLAKLHTHEEREATCYGTHSIGTTGAFVR